MTIDSTVWSTARRMGYNISHVCEDALVKKNGSMENPILMCECGVTKAPLSAWKHWNMKCPNCNEVGKTTQEKDAKLSEFENQSYTG
jgi:phage FluMu protein Com